MIFYCVECGTVDYSKGLTIRCGRVICDECRAKEDKKKEVKTQAIVEIVRKHC